MQPFTISIPDSVLQEIHAKVEAYSWGEEPEDGGWEYGTNLSYFKKFRDYWLTKYDWRAQEAFMNGFAHFTGVVDGFNMHWIHEKGSGASPAPLVLLHGWPGSFVEFLQVIEPLAHPERFGGKEEDAFDVIVPSLPGFAWSRPLKRPIGPRGMAGIIDTLMTRELGYAGYMAQGGDWGSMVSNWLGYEHGATCRAIHINYAGMRHVSGPLTEEEKAWEKKLLVDQLGEDGYRTQMATKPQTLSYAMLDSPVGAAAWLLEKFYTWSSVVDSIDAVFSKDDLLTNIMVYLVTRSFNTASWVYYGRRLEGEALAGPGHIERSARLLGTDGRRVEVPVACALFPDELLTWPPRSYCERLYNIAQWSELPRGGHFAAMEAPDVFIADVQKFGRLIRNTL